MKKLVALLLAVLMVMSAAAFAEPVVSEPEMPLTDTPANYDAMIVLHGMDVGDPNEKSSARPSPTTPPRWTSPTGRARRA